MCMSVWTCLVHSYTYYLVIHLGYIGYRRNACFTDLFLVCITFERISTLSLFWQCVNPCNTWKATMAEACRATVGGWSRLQAIGRLDCGNGGGSKIVPAMCWYHGHDLASFLHASNAKICEVQHMNELEVGFVCLCRSGFEWSLSHIRCCHQEGMVWTCYEPLVEWNSCCMKLSRGFLGC